MAEPRERPLSPHLQIYRWSLTMALSILHRASGVALLFGLLLLLWWLVALASGEAAFATVRAVTGSPIGVLALFVLTLVLYYHLANGVRHLVWDAGFGFDKETARQSGVFVVVAAVGLTLLTWLAVLVI